MKESKAMMKKEVAFMKKKGAPKSMIRHEMKEAGMKKGVKKMAFGGGIGAMSGPGFSVPQGMSGGSGSSPREAVGTPTMAMGTSGGNSRLARELGAGLKQRARPVQERGTRMAKGGSVGSFRKAADGVAHKGKTKGKMVKMAYGGKC